MNNTFIDIVENLITKYHKALDLQDAQLVNEIKSSFVQIGVNIQSTREGTIWELNH